MMKFKKDFNYKIIFVTISFLFIFNILLYAVPTSSQKETLRVPLNNLKRVEKILQIVDDKSDIRDKEAKNGLRRIGLNLAYLPSEDTIDYTQLVEAFDSAIVAGKLATNGLTMEDIIFLKKFSAIFNEEYYMKGTVSAYMNYKWKPELVIPRVRAIIEHCDLKAGDKVLDVGCAFGYYVRSLRAEGINAEGLEISSYALRQADSETAKYLHLMDNLGILNKLQHKKFDLIILKDVLEHTPEEILPRFLLSIRKLGKKILIILPITDERGYYIYQGAEHDLTHVVRRDKNWWCSVLGSDYQTLDNLNQVIEGDKAGGTLCALFSYQATDILTELDKQRQMIGIIETGL